MAEDAVDLAVKVGSLKQASPCVTRGLSLTGATGWHPALFAELAQSHALDIHTAKHLAHAYGDRARAVLEVRCRHHLAWPV
jgi:glycerol-3-phosphate dehydrogenase